MLGTMKPPSLASQLKLFEPSPTTWVGKLWQVVPSERRKEVVQVLAEMAVGALAQRESPPDGAPTKDPEAQHDT